MVINRDIKNYFYDMSTYHMIPKPDFIEIDDELQFEYNLAIHKLITHKQLSEFIKNDQLFLDKFKKIAIIDVRFYYEFLGGKIIGAKNIRTKKELIELYNSYKDTGKEIAIIFHCEFSKERGPKVMELFRKYDREMNNYPNLSFPNIYLLEGGYKEFYLHYPELCCGGYVSMRDQQFIENGELRKCTTFFRKNMTEENFLSNHNRFSFLFNLFDLSIDEINFNFEFSNQI